MTPEERMESRRLEREAEEQAKADCEQEFGTHRLSERVRALIWAKAWEDGHAHGLHEVRFHYADLAELVIEAVQP